MRRIVGLAVLGVMTIVGCGGDHEADHGGAAVALPESTPIAPVTTDAVYVVNGEDNTISVVDPVLGAVVGTIALKNVKYPHHVYLSPDGTRLAVAVPGHDLSRGHSASAPSATGEHGAHGGAQPTGAVIVLDAATGTTIKARLLGAPNHNAIFSPDGREIWTAQLAEEGKVHVLDANTLETRQTIDVGKVPAEVTFSPDGRHAFVANGTSDDVTVIDVATKAVVKTIAVDREPVGAWPGADGMMYVDCEVAKTVKVIDPKTLEVVRSYALGFTPGFAVVPPQRTDELWVTDTDSGKVVFNKTSGDEKTGDVMTAAGAHALAFTPDGTTAFVTNQLGDSLSVVDTATRTVKTTVALGKKPNGIVYRAK